MEAQIGCLNVDIDQDHAIGCKVNQSATLYELPDKVEGDKEVQVVAIGLECVQGCKAVNNHAKGREVYRCSALPIGIEAGVHDR